jgi:hypothetical protein
MVYHLSIGHFSVAMRSLAHVEQPHFLQRPVPLSASESQNSQLLQWLRRSSKTFSSAILNPFEAQTTVDFVAVLTILEIVGVFISDDSVLEIGASTSLNRLLHKAFFHLLLGQDAHGSEKSTPHVQLGQRFFLKICIDSGSFIHS